MLNLTDAQTFKVVFMAVHLQLLWMQLIGKPTEQVFTMDAQVLMLTTISCW